MSEPEKPVDSEEPVTDGSGNVLTRWLTPKPKEPMSEQPPRRLPLPLSQNPVGKASEKIDEF